MDNNTLIEMYGAPDTFCEGLARIDQLGPCRRLTFYGAAGIKLNSGFWLRLGSEEPTLRAGALHAQQSRPGLEIPPTSSR
jgi:hypothetical protein